MSQPSSFSGVAAWALNIVSSVGIIMVNKQVMTGYGFVYGEWGRKTGTGIVKADT